MSGQLLAEELYEAMLDTFASGRPVANLDSIVERACAALRAQGEPVAYLYDDGVHDKFREGEVMKSTDETAQAALQACPAIGSMERAHKVAKAVLRAQPSPAGFEPWLREVCFQKPTPEAYDLAKCAWQEALRAAPGAEYPKYDLKCTVHEPPAAPEHDAVGAEKMAGVRRELLLQDLQTIEPRKPSKVQMDSYQRLHAVIAAQPAHGERESVSVAAVQIPSHQCDCAIFKTGKCSCVPVMVWTTKECADQIAAVTPTKQPDAEGGQAISEIAAERARQQSAEGWTLAHDDEHINGEMAAAAACYALRASPQQFDYAHDLWPWDDKWWKPKAIRQDLVRAGALIVAEIERLDRLSVVLEKKS